ncbi:MAG: rhomboid family intramembrane serine protease [Candidatus Hydrogenedentes bacterium]|nr:rhomboid family intramembrane serine protease [Candidatus Hydrogenedentota bacterium]
MFPIRDTIPSRHPPLATIMLILANVGVFVYQLQMPERQLERVFYAYGIVPARFTHPSWAGFIGFPDNYWPFLTSMFLHGGWIHILSNMWTLWIFGDNVEDRMGSFRFTVFYFLCGVASGIAHLITNSTSTIPALGASGAIAGVLAAYFFLFPLSRILCVFPILFYPVFFEVYAFIYGIIWFWMQSLSGVLSLADPEQAGGIAWWAHIGGGIAGITLHRYFLSEQRAPRRYFPGPVRH